MENEKIKKLFTGRCWQSKTIRSGRVKWPLLMKIWGMFLFTAGRISLITTVNKKVCIYIYIHIHTHTHTYICTYKWEYFFFQLFMGTHPSTRFMGRYLINWGSSKNYLLWTWPPNLGHPPPLSGACYPKNMLPVSYSLFFSMNE